MGYNEVTPEWGSTGGLRLTRKGSRSYFPGKPVYCLDTYGIRQAWRSHLGIRSYHGYHVATHQLSPYRFPESIPTAPWSRDGSTVLTVGSFLIASPSKQPSQYLGDRQYG